MKKSLEGARSFAAPEGENPEGGAGMIGIVAVMGLVFALVQGTLFYKTKTSARFLAGEKNKIVAQQVAEAGVEENIADLGSRKVIATSGMTEYTTYQTRSVGAGNFTSTLTTLGMGAEADTVLLKSHGRISATSQSVSAKLRVKRYVDTIQDTLSQSVTTWNNVTVIDTVRTISVTTVVQNPSAMPILNTTPAYNACMASAGKKCDVCHIPGGNPSNRHVININKNAIHTHISHHGDYVTTDGTCDIYNPRVDSTVVETYNSSTVSVPVVTIVLDTIQRIDTAAKVQILSWK